MYTCDTFFIRILFHLRRNQSVPCSQVSLLFIRFSYSSVFNNVWQYGVPEAPSRFHADKIKN